MGRGWRRRPGIGDIDGRKTKMPPFYRRHEVALAPQSEQIWVESLSLTTERRRQAVERAFEQLAEHHPVLAIQAYVRAGIRACATRGIQISHHAAIAHIGPT